MMSMKQFKTKKETVNQALNEYLRIIMSQELLKMKGSNVWEGDLEQMRLD